MASVPNPPPSRAAPSGPLTGVGTTPGALLRSNLQTVVTGASVAREFGNTLTEIKENMQLTTGPFFRPSLANCNVNRKYRVKAGFVVSAATQGVSVQIQVSKDDFATATSVVTSFTSGGRAPVNIAHEFSAIAGLVDGDTLKARIRVSAEGDTPGQVVSNDPDGIAAFAELIEVL